MAATGTFDSVAAAIESGIVGVVGSEVAGGFVVINGGAAAPVISLTESALGVAQSAELAATAATAETAAVTVAKTSAGAKLMGLMSMELPAVAAAAAPLAGAVLGYDLYEANPYLWTRISETLLPFCYAENKFKAYLDFVVDVATGQKTPIVLIETAIIEALRALFEDEVIPKESYEIDIDLDPDIRVYGTIFPTPHTYRNTVYGEGATFFGWLDNYKGIAFSATNFSGADYDTQYNFYYKEYSYPIGLDDAKFFVTGGAPNLGYIIATILGTLEPGPRTYPAGTAEPAVPIEPEEWPDEPVIIPFPGSDPETIPVTPITPFPLPFQPIPYEPEKYPDPTPDEPPDNWPEEEPWPKIIPFPVQPTEPNPDLPSPDWPDPDSPTIIPWPLPAEPPEQWPEEPPDNWPETPEGWPEEVPWPEDVPWPDAPNEWPDEVPWPENPPEWWPEEGEPWPETPEEWPEEYPWPMPPAWPVNWPEELPYPWPFTYPEPSQDPYPDPREIESPERQIDPYITPWPFQLPNPYADPSNDPNSNPDPYADPSQPSNPDEPGENPDNPPIDPYPTPPDGELDDPLPPLIPLPFSSTTGLITVYHPTQQQLLSFAHWLWVTWQDATIDKVWNNPFDGVITLFELYCTPTDVGTKTIRSGFLDSGISSAIISRYTEINCGSIGVPEYFGNYLDYAPYSKCHIYLPFIGMVELNVDDIVGHGVNVTYRIDEYNGSCIAIITVAKSTVVNGETVDYSTIMYQFSGNCAVELPLSGGSQAAIRSGLIEAAAWGIGSIIGGILSAGSTLGNIGSNLAYGASGAVRSVTSAKSSVQHSGSFGSSYGAMGAKKPFIVVTRPKQIQVPNYNLLYGYQAHKMVKIGSCTGYIRCHEVHVVSPTASDEEKAEIELLLKTGVYVTE